MHDIAWSGGVMFKEPDLVRRIHEHYILAGADIVTANSYSCCRHVLEPAGFGGKVEDANRLAIRLAREARNNAAHGRPVAIAGSISMFVADDADPYLHKSSDSRDWRSQQSLYSCYREQAQILADEGADFLLWRCFRCRNGAFPPSTRPSKPGCPSGSA